MSIASTGLSHPPLIWEYVLSHIVTCYAAFHGYPWEACNFLKGNGSEVDMGVRGGGGMGGIEGRETMVKMYWKQKIKIKKSFKEMTM